MKGIPLVSIIIPVYNKATVVKETLDSALAQAYPNTELILVNDGSTDSSLEILREYASTYPDKIQLLNSSNRGVSAATNLGFQASRGEYIQFLDADDLLSPEKIERQIELLEGDDRRTIATCDWLNFEASVVGAKRPPYGVFRDFDRGLDLLLRFFDHQEMHQPAVYLVHRELIVESGLWNESLTVNQDGEFFCGILLKAGKVKYEPEGKVYYRKPGKSNVSQQKSEKAIASLLDSLVSCEQMILKFEDSVRVRMALKKVYQKFIYDVFPRFPHLIGLAERRILSLNVEEAIYVGGPKFRMLSKIVGFKNAIRLKRLL